MGLTTSAHQILRGTDAIPEAFWELADRYRDALVEQALRIVHSRADAEDVVQETFREAFAQGGALPGVRSLGAWLKTVNRANALNRLRTKKQDAQLSRKGAKLGRPRATTGGFTALELRDQLAQAMRALPAEQQAAVKLHFYEHLPTDEISKRLKLSVRSVRRLLFDASMRLHATLKPTHPTPPCDGEAPR